MKKDHFYCQVSVKVKTNQLTVSPGQTILILNPGDLEKLTNALADAQTFTGINYNNILTNSKTIKI